MLTTDAPGNAIGAALTQNGQPAAFVSHKVSDLGFNWSAIQTEAFAIVWSVRNCWRYWLRSHYTILTDQEAVSSMFDSKSWSSFKNSKLYWWRLVLSEYDFDVQCNKGKLNVVADAISRVSAFCSQLDETGYDAIDEEKNKKYIAGDISLILKEVHNRMGHPGIARTVEIIQRNFDVPE